MFKKNKCIQVMVDNKKIGLALSGGGFRAAAFHLGVFRKLNELGILSNIDFISYNFRRFNYWCILCIK